MGILPEAVLLQEGPDEDFHEVVGVDEGCHGEEEAGGDYHESEGVLEQDPSCQAFQTWLDPKKREGKKKKKKKKKHKV